MKKIGFNHFLGVDGSKSMIEGARKTGLYQDLKLCVLGEQDLPVEKGAQKKKLKITTKKTYTAKKVCDILLLQIR